MTNKAIRARFAERLETAHKTPKTAQSISLVCITGFGATRLTR